jgi:hypothetical protein
MRPPGWSLRGPRGLRPMRPPGWSPRGLRGLRPMGPPGSAPTGPPGSTETAWAEADGAAWAPARTGMRTNAVRRAVESRWVMGSRRMAVGRWCAGGRGVVRIPPGPGMASVRPGTSPRYGSPAGPSSPGPAPPFRRPPVRTFRVVSATTAVKSPLDGFPDASFRIEVNSCHQIPTRRRRRNRVGISWELFTPIPQSSFVDAPSGDFGATRSGWGHSPPRARGPRSAGSPQQPGSDARSVVRDPEGRRATRGAALGYDAFDLRNRPQDRGPRSAPDPGVPDRLLDPGSRSTPALRGPRPAPATRGPRPTPASGVRDRPLRPGSATDPCVRGPRPAPGPGVRDRPLRPESPTGQWTLSPRPIPEPPPAAPDASLHAEEP